MKSEDANGSCAFELFLNSMKDKFKHEEPSLLNFLFYSDLILRVII